jgi:predicted regulator of Ras-like GTPase activity (Roadblock/LC7/MglB family)
VNAPTARQTGSTQARNLRWLLENLVDDVPGILSVAVVSSDGLPLLSSDRRLDGSAAENAAAENAAAENATASGDSGDSGGSGQGSERTEGPESPFFRRGGGRSPRGTSADLATIISGLGSLTLGAAKLMDGGAIRQTVVAMDEGSLFVMSISDGSLLGVHATPDCDMSVIAYHMALFVGRAGHVLTPELRTELRTSMELDQ